MGFFRSKVKTNDIILEQIKTPWNKQTIKKDDTNNTFINNFNVIKNNDSLEQKVNKLIEYSDYLSKNLNYSIEYTEYIAKQLEIVKRKV